MVIQQLADDTQAALLVRDGRLAFLEHNTGSLMVRAGANLIATSQGAQIDTGIPHLLACVAVNGDPAANPGQVTAVKVSGSMASIYHTFAPGQARVHWIAVGAA
jgi:hypothetical protein